MKWIAAIALLCLAASFPPMPPETRKLPKTVRGGGAADLLVRPKAMVAPAPKAVLIKWNYPSTPDVGFNVRRFKGTAPERPSTSWPIVATVFTNSFQDTIDPSAKLVIYTVTATNIAYGLESSWATK